MAKFRIVRKSAIDEKDQMIAKLESEVQHLEAELGLWKPTRGKGGKFVKKSLTTQTN
jgi:hypothetical protein